MSAFVKLSQLRQRARFEADMLKGGSSAFVEDADLNTLANVYIGEVFDIMLLGGPPDYYSVDYPLTTVTNKLDYLLPDDYRSLLDVYVVEDATTSYKRPIRALGDLDCIQYRAPQGEFNVLIRYTPKPPELTTDESRFDGVSGWDQYVVSSMARDMVLKQGGLNVIPVINAKLMQLAARIRTQSSMRRQGSPRYVTDVGNYDWPWIYSQNLNGFRERGDRTGRPLIELYSLYPAWPISGV